jgi:ferredoxin-type protein NapH
MLPLKDQDRVRVLSAVATRGPAYFTARVVVITLSLAILLVVPLCGIVRVDLWRGEHLVLGHKASLVGALQAFVIAMAVLYGLTFLSNIVVGRFFCGWGCPVGYVSRLGETVDRNKSRLRKWLSHGFGAAFVATFVGAVMLWWVDPRVLVDGSPLAIGVTLGTFAVLWAGGHLHAFLWRFAFCVKVCPIGLYYRYVTSKAPVGIVFSQVPSPCIECAACEKICPVDLDPKALGTPLRRQEGSTTVELYGDAECIRCGDCIEACRMIFKRRLGETPPLRFGWTTVDAASCRVSGDGERTVPGP